MMRVVLAGLLALCMSGREAAAQSDWSRLLPHVHYFRPLVADLLEPRLGLALLHTDVFEHADEGAERQAFSFPDPADAAHDVQVAAAIGGSLPLWHLKEWPGKGGIVASAQLGVFARFRMEYPTREKTGSDWFIGMPIEIAYDRFEGRFRIMHRSSHLGDELVQTTSAERIEFGGEYADFIGAYRVAGDLRVYGGATYNFRSYTERLEALRARDRHDTGAVQAGMDGGWYLWSQGRAGLIGGIDWQSAQRTNWRSAFAVAGGVAVRTPTRASRVLLRYFTGPSSMGEFFLTPETFWALEWVIDF